VRVSQVACSWGIERPACSARLTVAMQTSVGFSPDDTKERIWLRTQLGTTMG